MKAWCKSCLTNSHWVDTGEVLSNWHPARNAFECEHCGARGIVRHTIFNYIATNGQGVPQPCTHCRSLNVEFSFTEPDHNDGYKCLTCGETFPGAGSTIATWKFNTMSVSIQSPTLEERVKKLEDLHADN